MALFTWFTEVKGECLLQLLQSSIREVDLVVDPTVSNSQ